MSLSKKHFQRLAQILGETNANDEIIEEIMQWCKEMNPRFTPVKFLLALKKARKKTLEDLSIEKEIV